MGVRVKRGRWPDVDGDYEIVDGDGWLLLYAMADHFGPDTEAVAERILVAINGDTVPAPTLPDDLPSWVSMHATATGADLIEHDPNGEEWERWWANEWWTDHAAAADRRSTYLVRRRPVPVEPTTEKVPLHKVHGRTLDGYSWKVGIIGMDADGLWWAAASGDHARLALTIDADGKVTVLREDGAS